MLHAMALSDGLEGKGAELYRSFEIIRERERLDKAIDNLKRLLARRAVLRSERKPNQPIDSRGLEEMAGKEAAAALIASVVGRARAAACEPRSAETRSRGDRRLGRKGAAEPARAAGSHGLSLKDRAERLDVLNGVQSKGIAQRLQRLPGAQRHGSVEEREDEVRGLLAQTELKLSQAQQDKMKLDVEAQVELARDLRDLEAQIAEEQLTISASRRLLAMAGQPIDRKSFGNLSYEIVRRTAKGPLQIAAEEMTALEAGDLLKVTSPTTLGSD